LAISKNEALSIIFF